MFRLDQQQFLLTFCCSDGNTKRQIDRKTEKHYTKRHYTERHYTERHTERLKDNMTIRQKDRKTERQ